MRAFVLPCALLAAHISLGMVCAVATAAAPQSKTLPWSFKPIANAKPPQVANASWPRDDLDRFILAKLEQQQLPPNRDADRYVLLRRVSLDLTGLPPAEPQIAAFVADRSHDDQALAKVVDQLLASPRFGERWARHWLDVVHYADSAGRTFNPPLTYAWRYRDYVIDAFNHDKPYDRFVLEQLAGDLLPAKTVAERRENLVATGMLALTAFDLQALDFRQYEMDCIDDQIDVMSRTFLGLTIACARCHDHKYDPVSTRDYYALAGIFSSTRSRPGVSYRGAGNGYVDHEELLALPTALGSTAAPPKLVPGVHSMNDFNEVWRTGKRDIRYATDPNLSMGLVDDEIADCAIRIKGDPHDHGETPPRGDLRLPSLPRITRPSSQASGRMELARWITAREHPLTSRVMVNRVWQHLFGRGLVATPDDFGAMSEPPSHPELLDFMSRRLMDQGWSLKKLIRSIVLSRTYRLSSDTLGAAAQDKDADNRYYWRANLRRLEFEPLRDSLLFVASRLSFDRPEGVQVAGIGGKSNKTSASSLLDLDDACRTIYLPILRSRLPDSYGTFDFPDPCQIVGQREVTTVAPQALFFMNNQLVSSCAAEVVDGLAKSALANDAARVNALYLRLLGRPATGEEIREAATLLQALTSSADERWATLVQALLCSAPFRYVR